MMVRHNRKRCTFCGKLFKRLSLHTYYAHSGVKRTHKSPLRLRGIPTITVADQLPKLGKAKPADRERKAMNRVNNRTCPVHDKVFPTMQGFLAHMRLTHRLTAATVHLLQGQLSWNKRTIEATIEHQATPTPQLHPLGWDVAETSVENDGRQAMLNAAHAVLATPEPGKEYPLMMGEFINKDTIRDVDTGLLYVAISAIVYLTNRVPPTWKLD